jgi:hypothetical protein
MAIDIPLADIHNVKESVTQLNHAFGRLRVLAEKHGDNVRAIHHRFQPHSLTSEDSDTHPWIATSVVDENPVDACISAVSDIWFPDSRLDPRRTRIYPGVVIAPEEIYEHVIHINTLKKNFEDQIAAIKKTHRSFTDSEIESRISFDRDGLTRANEGLKRTLQKAGVARICVKQTKRHIPIIHGHLMRSKYYYVPKRPSRTRTVSSQTTLLRTKQSRGDNTPALGHALEVLATYPPDLLISERQAPSFIATANCKTRDANDVVEWSQYTAVMPAFAVSGEPLDQIIKFEGLDVDIANRQMTPTKPTKWEESPFLPYYRLHLPRDYAAKL